MKTDETEFMCFNQGGAISSLNSKPLKLIDQFMYLDSNITSTENNVKGKVWSNIDRLMTIWTC